MNIKTMIGDYKNIKFLSCESEYVNNRHNRLAEDVIINIGLRKHSFCKSNPKYAIDKNRIISKLSQISDKSTNLDLDTFFNWLYGIRPLSTFSSYIDQIKLKRNAVHDDRNYRKSANYRYHKNIRF